MAEERIGTVTHYFGEPEVGIIALEGDLSVGDTIRIRGHTTDFQQVIGSMEIEHERVEEAGAGDEVGVKVEERVREGDEVYRVTEG